MGTVVKERFHFLDGLRGIASLMIVFHHAFTSNIVQGLNHIGAHLPAFYLAYFTQSGVELFFVLSGVVLLRPYLRKEKRFEVGTYLLRRIKRIYPPYLVALLFAAWVCWYLRAFPTWYIDKVFHMYFSWQEVIRESIIINFENRYYNLAWWSLGIEMLFYFVVPLIVFCFPKPEKLNTARVLLLLVATLVCSIGLQLFLTRYYPSLYSYKVLSLDIYQSVCYPVCFLLGVLLAARDFSEVYARIFIVCGLALVAASWFYLPIVNTGYGLIYAGVIIFSFNKAALKRILSLPIMIWLGERSYSLFLVHFSVFYMVDNFVAYFTTSRSLAYALLSRGIGIPLALFAAMLLFNFVERWQARGLVTGNMFWPWQAKRPDSLV